MMVAGTARKGVWRDKTFDPFYRIPDYALNEFIRVGAREATAQPLEREIVTKFLGVYQSSTALTR